MEKAAAKNATAKKAVAAEEMKIRFGKVHAHEEGPRTVELTPAAMRSARIVVAPAEAGSLSRTLSLPARITLDPRRVARASDFLHGGGCPTRIVAPIASARGRTPGNG